MFVTFTTEDGSSQERLEINPDTPVAELKSLLEAIFGIPAAQQVFVSNGAQLGTVGTIGSLGVKDNDMVLIVNSVNRTTGASAPAPVAATTGASSSIDAGAYMNIQDVFQRNQNPTVIAKIIRSSDRLMQQLRANNPELAGKMTGDEASAIRELRMFMMKMAAGQHFQLLEKNKTEQLMKERIERDANDPEAKLYFDQKHAESLRDIAQEQFPESFIPVLMLYIEVEINNTPIQAFVDTGAQTSVISAKCAERCGLTKSIDKKFAGSVVGVGNGKTLGRVHMAQLKIEGKYFPVSLTVMDDSQGLGDPNMEFLLGLDMLMRHQCKVSLKTNEKCLYFTYDNVELSTPFLAEKDLPKSKGGNRDYNPNSESK